ncbi:DHH family phosphoesterase, partial [Candidatus Bathyarchaeota archaeon]|nr:DHH family phosphoesterase [Candidatus Bathyarchaeota archaeon]
LLWDLKAVEKGDILILCDIALSDENLSELIRVFSSLAEKGDFIYLDHHPLPEGIDKSELPGSVIHNLGSSSSELAYFHFKPSINQARTAIIGAIGDYLEGTPGIQELLAKFDKRALYFEAGILIQGIEGIRRDYDFKRKILQELARNLPPSSDRELVNLALHQAKREDEALKELAKYIHRIGRIAYTVNFPFSLGKTAIYLMGLTDAPIGVAGEKWKGCVDASFRTRSPFINLNLILRRVAPKFGGSGGGHPMAAGARVPEESFENFLVEVDNSLEEFLPKEI